MQSCFTDNEKDIDLIIMKFVVYAEEIIYFSIC